MKYLIYVALLFSSVLSLAQDLTVGSAVSIGSGKVFGKVVSVSGNNAVINFAGAGEMSMPVDLLDKPVENSSMLGKSVSIGNGQLSGVVLKHFENGTVLVAFQSGEVLEAVSIENLDK